MSDIYVIRDNTLVVRAGDVAQPLLGRGLISRENILG